MEATLKAQTIGGSLGLDTSEGISQFNNALALHVINLLTVAQQLNVVTSAALPQNKEQAAAAGPPEDTEAQSLEELVAQQRRAAALTQSLQEPALPAEAKEEWTSLATAMEQALSRR